MQDKGASNDVDEDEEEEDERFKKVLDMETKKKQQLQEQNIESISKVKSQQ